MNVYSISIRDGINEDSLKYWIEKISEKKKERVKKYKCIDDKKRSIYGELLLRHVLVHEMRIKNEKIVIDLDFNGKPYLKGISNVFFNISHSGEYVICAVDSYPIGVDIELIDSAEVIVSNKIFTENERKLILAKEEMKNILFCQFWTLKECYLKYKGVGLRIPLTSISFVVNGDDIKMESRTEDNIYFSSGMFMEQYWISVCAEVEHELNNIKHLSIDDLS